MAYLDRKLICDYQSYLVIVVIVWIDSAWEPTSILLEEVCFRRHIELCCSKPGSVSRDSNHSMMLLRPLLVCETNTPPK